MKITFHGRKIIGVDNMNQYYSVNLKKRHSMSLLIIQTFVFIKKIYQIYMISLKFLKSTSPRKSLIWQLKLE